MAVGTFVQSWRAPNIPGEPALNFAAPSDAFKAYLKLSFTAGILIAAPLIFYQLWGFIAATAAVVGTARASPPATPALGSRRAFRIEICDVLVETSMRLQSVSPDRSITNVDLSPTPHTSFVRPWPPSMGNCSKRCGGSALPTNTSSPWRRLSRQVVD